MVKELLIIVVGLIVLGLIFVFVVPNLPSGTKPVACTLDAKICPDGSAVGRVGPNCEFASCPGEAQQPQY